MMTGRSAILKFVVTVAAVLAASQAAKIPTDSFVVSKFRSNTEVTSLLQSLASKYPTLARLHNIGSSTQGRQLWAIQISDNVHTREVGEPRFKYIANMHGDETVGRELLLNLAQYLLENYHKDSRVGQLVNRTDIYLMPSMNPDGFERSVEGDCEGVHHGRQNAQGIDLNRDFPEQYSRAIKTKFAPETKSLMTWIQEDPYFVLSANIHGGVLVANYPYDSSASHTPTGDYNASPDDAMFRQLALTYAKAHPEMIATPQCRNAHFKDGITNGAYWYEARGGMQDYNYLHGQCMELTLELSCCKHPYASTLPGFWAKNKEPLLAFMEKVHTGVKGVVQDAMGLPLPGATVSIQNTGRVLKTTKNGEYWALLPTGSYVMTVKTSNLNYRSATITVPDGPKALVLNVVVGVNGSMQFYTV